MEAHVHSILVLVEVKAANVDVVEEDAVDVGDAMGKMLLPLESVERKERLSLDIDLEAYRFERTPYQG